MKKAGLIIVTQAILLFTLVPFGIVKAESFDAKAFFERECMACHTIGDGTMVGPDLEGVVFEREKSWLIEFIASSQDKQDAGDPIALELADEYPGMMPDFDHLEESEIKAIIDYIAEESGGWPEEENDEASQPSDEQVTEKKTEAPEEVEPDKEVAKAPSEEEVEAEEQQAENISEPEEEVTETEGPSKNTENEEVQAEEVEESFAMTLNQILVILIITVLIAISVLLKKVFTN